jgi:hypothetical protein
VHIKTNESANLFHDSISCLPEPTLGRDRTCYLQGQEGHVIWPSAKEGALTLTSAQLAMLIEGLDWRRALPMTEVVKPTAI